MINTKRTVNLDEVLADYALASQEFDAKVLQAFIDKYPEHSRALQRYAHMQLTSVRATIQEIEKESISDEEMLPRQSRLLKRMQELRQVSSVSDGLRSVEKLATIFGDQATKRAAIVVFGSCDHGEDLLLLSVMESTAAVNNVPYWFYVELGTHIGVAPAALVAGLEIKWRQSGVQRFSAKGKPNIEATSLTWAKLVEDCIFDDAVKESIMKRS